MAKTKTKTAAGDDKPPKKKVIQVKIKPPNMERVTVEVRGTSPYAHNRFSGAKQEAMKKTQEAGSKKAGTKKRAKSPRDFDRDYKLACHRSTEGWLGIPATAFRASMVRACKPCGIVMADAKITIFVDQDGFDDDDGSPLVKIVGEPVRWIAPARNADGGADLRIRPKWDKWSAKVTIRYDADFFTASDVINLLARAGAQVGIGEGRADSRKCVGIGFGFFEIKIGTMRAYG